MTTPSRSLVTIEARFVTAEATEPLLDRIQEAIVNIVGRSSLEEFRAKSMLLDPPKKPGRSVT